MPEQDLLMSQKLPLMISSFAVIIDDLEDELKEADGYLESLEALKALNVLLAIELDIIEEGQIKISEPIDVFVTFASSLIAELPDGQTKSDLTIMINDIKLYETRAESLSEFDFVNASPNEEELGEEAEETEEDEEEDEDINEKEDLNI